MADDTETIGFRLTAPRKSTLLRLTGLANYERPNQLMNALLDQLAKVKEPFDVRDVKVTTRK